MTIQFLDGNVLIRGGSIATHSDCCCTPGCLTCPDKVFYCYPNPCGAGCRLIEDFTFSIDGVAENSYYTFCKCYLFNGSYSVALDYPTYTRSATFTVLNGPCGTTFPSNIYSRKYTVNAIWDYTDTALNITIGNALPFPLDRVFPISSGRGCTDFTVNPGHFLQITLTDVYDYGYVGGVLTQGTRYLTYIREFNNAEVPEGCPVDQGYGLCSGIDTGPLTLVGAYVKIAGTGFPTAQYCSEITQYPFCTKPTSVTLDSVTLEEITC